MKAKTRPAKSTTKKIAAAKGARGAKGKRPRAKAAPQSAELAILHRHAAGIDCGSQEHYVAVPPEAVAPGEAKVRAFSAFTHGLDSLVEWLKACGVTTEAAVYGTSGGRRMGEPMGSTAWSSG